MSHSFIFSLLFLLILSSTQLRYKAEGRSIPKSDEEKARLRAQIGSRPPRCERRCNSCDHCEAIQVPTNPQISHVAYARGDGSSYYKPMSWKCKCGNFIFNP
ncbi:hypothetical protein ERO13_A02G148201v2 [Gossypium hirsutum]|uniref:Epidermal patterning factor-like protein n=5 Tax=Gossypium TaxID=3633 RepID=A0A1U8MCL3_GOSHI|nr:EPIDERMAL PATTERNING FACTOR-like protein 2 [Gossypium hirsutum]XP_016741310.1 EPIDERMAL PATTERNING FACTOR-like protein 2 [Gossypium hirsutum]XP_017625851.1 EPIDERMAL PATTERNING FACTOR-like protein 2 [Gossypium arboreum]KAB2094482.1 hypothetical protein ES319_A02G161900v1 [Gossypium barbadense]TYH28871.1 hypothetical protein ES288_A02G178200v1 [Gossypium darwinii]TYH79069.1 hypothetical protein ES332_D03G036000v1 [Gossypium tomentosum]TYI89151.1 hypothetical protein E1A91_D03G034200v1 [Goss